MLTLYLRKPILGELSPAGTPRPWRVDMFECSRLAPGTPVPDEDLIDFVQHSAVDRQERVISPEVLRQYDLDEGFTRAVLDAYNHV